MNADFCASVRPPLALSLAGVGGEVVQSCVVAIVVVGWEFGEEEGIGVGVGQGSQRSGLKLSASGPQISTE